MGEATRIAWTDHTWNPWVGCTRVSPGCDHCYMFTGRERYGQDPALVVRSKTTWHDPVRWEQAAARSSQRERVFTCSWSDWFHSAADPWREEAWAIIARCPHLDFQILTKRPGRIRTHLPADWGSGYPNVWLGVSIESDRYVRRAELLRRISAVVRFLSLEPLLGPLPSLNLTDIDWVIVGGESGPGYRRMDHAWVRDLEEQCRAAHVAFFFKQSAALHSERGIELDGRIRRAFPTPRSP
jgi:protein gp37